MDLYPEFRVGTSGLVVYHLQYADDTLLVVDPTIDNLWSIKVILKGFELDKGFQVNLFKSILIGINVNPTFLSFV